MKVNVNRDKQSSGIDGPQSEVNTVRGPDHPSKKEQQPLAAAGVSWVGQKVPRSHAGSRHAQVARFSHPVAEADQGLSHGSRSTEVHLECDFERSGHALRGPRANQQPSQVGAHEHSVFPSAQANCDLLRILGRPSWARAQTVE
jgi:hypothetical protein